MQRTPYWIDTAEIKRFPALNHDVKVDVLVVGAGLTGISAAYLLTKAGLTVALIERERAAMIDTGHTTAHLTFVTDADMQDLVDDVGRDHAQATWDAGNAAIDEIEAIVQREQIDCEFTRVPGYQYVAEEKDTESEAKYLKKETDLARELGFDATFLDSVPLFNRPGIRFPNQAKFHPRKYLSRLIELIGENGGLVFEESPAGEFDSEKRRVKVNDNWISFERVILATHNPLLGLANAASATLLQTKLSLYTSYVLGATVPLGALPIALMWDTKEPYDYLRVNRYDAQDYAIFGGDDHKTGQVDETGKRFASLIARFKKFAPSARIDHTWSGQVIETNDGLPFIGENTDGQFISTGYAGNGMTFGTVGAMMARDWATGRKNPWSKLFAVDRKSFLSAPWDYLRENKDYPYYLIKDRIARAEADSVRELDNDCGMIVKSKDGKVAAYRDAKGEVTKVSAVCTHMGCIVRWNPAEKTWDCPCHGSRFKPGGELISGPAEAPLDPM